MKDLVRAANNVVSPRVPLFRYPILPFLRDILSRKYGASGYTYRIDSGADDIQ